MSVRDKHIESSAVVAHRDIDVQIITAVSQAAKVCYRYTPGFAFEVVGVSSFCSAKAGTVTGDVKIGANSVLSAAAAFTADTEVAAALVATKATRRGSKTAQLVVTYTTDGTGALTNGALTVRIRPRGLARETN